MILSELVYIYKLNLKKEGSNCNMKKVRVMASFLAIALTITSVCVSAGTIDAAKKPKLNKSKVMVKVGETVKLKVKNGNKKAKVTWKSSKKAIATVKKGKKSSATVKGIAEGKTKVTATYKFKGKKFKLKCNVTVDKAGNTDAGTANTPGTGTAAPSTASDQPGIENTKEPDNNNEPQNTPTKKPEATKRPTPTKTPVPSPSPTPNLVNPYKVDLSTVKTETDGVPGMVCEVQYNEETKSLDATMEGQSGFIVRSPITDRKDEYKYVQITYNLNSAGDVNIYAGQYDATTGQDGTGWSPEIKLNQYDMDKETTLILGSYDYLNGEPLGAIKIFNFGADTNISITDITFYMDGNKSEEITGPGEESAVIDVPLTNISYTSWSEVKATAETQDDGSVKLHWGADASDYTSVTFSFDAIDVSEYAYIVVDAEGSPATIEVQDATRIDNEYGGDVPLPAILFYGKTFPGKIALSEQNLSDKVDKDNKGPDYKNIGKICFTNGNDKKERTLTIKSIKFYKNAEDVPEDMQEIKK